MTEYTADTPLIAPPSASAAQALAYLSRRGSLYDAASLETIVAHYWRFAPAVGIDPVLALAQCIHETSEQVPPGSGTWLPLSSWWALRPRRNACGFGVTGHVSNRAQRSTVVVAGHAYPLWAQHGDIWEKGISFPTWELSAKAHLGRLVAYAVKPAARITEQRALAGYALALRALPATTQGAAPTIGGLGGKNRWAPSPTYWQGIARHMRAIGAVGV